MAIACTGCGWEHLHEKIGHNDKLLRDLHARIDVIEKECEKRPVAEMLDAWAALSVLYEEVWRYDKKTPNELSTPRHCAIEAAVKANLPQRVKALQREMLGETVAAGTDLNHMKLAEPNTANFTCRNCGFSTYWRPDIKRLECPGCERLYRLPTKG